MSSSAVTSEPSFATEASHEQVRYSQVWEDHRVLEAALAVGPGDDVLSLASAGDNVLALLRHAPRRVVAVDLSPAQVALTELKLIAVRELSAPELAAFLGARPTRDRSSTYARLAPLLSKSSRAYWGHHRELIRAGVQRCGLLDRYILGFQQTHVAQRVDRDAIRRLLALEDPEAQTHLFDAELAGIEPVVREWFGRGALSGRARDPSQFAHVGSIDVGLAFWRRFREVATTVPARGNFYLEWLLTGEYEDLELGPPHLVPAEHARLQGLTDRVEIVHAELGSFLRGQAPGSFSAVNLSDVFEYLSPVAAMQLSERVAVALRPGGRAAYWNLFVERSATGLGAGGLEPRPAEADALLATDRVPFYNAFRLERRAATQ